MGNMLSNLSNKLPAIDASFANALTIYAQGDNSYGTITNAVKQLDIVKLWTGNFQTFAVDKDGNLFAWGINDFYQLGNDKNVSYAFSKDEDKNSFNFIDTFSLLSSEQGYVSKVLLPAPKFPFTGRRIKTVACGDGFTVFLLKEGVLYSVGRDDKGQLGIDLPFKEAKVIAGKKCSHTLREIGFFSERKLTVTNLSCGSDFVFAQDELNHFYSWGNNDHYQLCRETVNYHSLTPEKVDSISSYKVNILKCGWMHGCLLSEKCELYIWGNPYYDYNNNYPDIKMPTIVQLPSHKIIDLSCGFHHMCVSLFENDKYELYSFGANDFGQLGYETNEEFITIPRKVIFPEEQGQIADVICGAFHTICKLNNNTLYGFGQNENKQIGDYSAEFITWPAIYNWKMNNSLFLYKILCGNGYTIILKRKSDEEGTEDQMIKESYVKVLPTID